MTSTQFSTIIRLFAEQNQYIDKRFDAMQSIIDKRFENESKKHTAEHLAIMKAIEAPFLDHETRLTRVEKTLFQLP